MEMNHHECLGRMYCSAAAYLRARNVTITVCSIYKQQRASRALRVRFTCVLGACSLCGGLGISVSFCDCDEIGGFHDAAFYALGEGVG